MYHRNRLTLNEFENKLWPFPLGIADYPAGPAMDASRYRIVQLYDLSAAGMRNLSGQTDRHARADSWITFDVHHRRGDRGPKE